MNIKNKITKVSWIEYNNHKFYPTKQGYWLGTVNKKPIRLHRYVWEQHNGKIPKGYHIHHKNGNKNDNRVENLEMLPAAAHLSAHSNEPKQKTIARENILKHGVPAAVKWHKSPKGKEWHKQHYKKSLEPKWAKTVKKICPICGKEFFVSELVKDRSVFCSENCKAQNRRNSGVDNIQKPCKLCGKMFSTNKYAQAKYCSKECRDEARKQANHHRRTSPSAQPNRKKLKTDGQK